MEFSKEQMEKAKACKTVEEFQTLAKAEGLEFSEEEARVYFNATHAGELSEDDLDRVAGGKGRVKVWSGTFNAKCPFCDASHTVDVVEYAEDDGRFGYEWKPKICACGADIEYWEDSKRILFRNSYDLRPSKK